jgi:ketosteroid isomerase-like protein
VPRGSEQGPTQRRSEKGGCDPQAQCREVGGQASGQIRRQAEGRAADALTAPVPEQGIDAGRVSECVRDTRGVSEENVELVRRALRAFSDGDLEGILEVWGTQAEWRPALLGGGLLEQAVYRGHAGVREFLRVQAETWAKVIARPVAIRDLGAVVLVEVRLEAVGRSSGASVARTTWNVFRFRDGVIADGRVFVDRAQALDAARESA